MRRLSLLLPILLSVASAQEWRSKIPNLILDTLVVPLASDSLEVPPLDGIVDGRAEGGSYLATRQKLKLGNYIPVDERIVLSDSLNLLLGKSLAAESVTFGGRLVVDHLSLWSDRSLSRKGEWVLNGYTRLEKEGGKTHYDWQWEVREGEMEDGRGKREDGKGGTNEAEEDEKRGGLSGLLSKKDRSKPEEVQRKKFGRLVSRWMDLQGQVLLDLPSVDLKISPHRYRRQLVTWMDLLLFPDGFGFEGRLSLDYPSDERDRYERGIPGFYYRKGPFYETAAVQRKTRLWYRRLGEKALFRATLTQRFGVNGYDHAKFDFLHFANIFSVGGTLSAVVESRPRYHRGLFWGAGILAGVNLTPAVEELQPELIKGDVPLDVFDLGLIITVGYRRP